MKLHKLGTFKDPLIDRQVMDIVRALTPDQWQAPTLLNGWVNFGGDYAPSGFYKDAANRVYLRGLIKDGTTTADTALFSLPEGYRPAHRAVFIVVSYPSGAINFGRIDVASDGGVLLNYGGNVATSLDGISFLAEQ